MISCRKQGGSCYSDACTIKGDCVTPDDHLHFERKANGELTAALAAANAKLEAAQQAEAKAVERAAGLASSLAKIHFTLGQIQIGRLDLVGPLSSYVGALRSDHAGALAAHDAALVAEKDAEIARLRERVAGLESQR